MLCPEIYNTNTGHVVGRSPVESWWVMIIEKALQISCTIFDIVATAQHSTALAILIPQRHPTAAENNIECAEEW